MRCLLTRSRSFGGESVPTWLSEGKEEFCRASGCEGEPGGEAFLLLRRTSQGHRIMRLQRQRKCGRL